MSQIEVGDLVALPGLLPGPADTGVVVEIDGTAAKVEMKGAGTVYAGLTALTRLDSDDLMAGAMAAETTELPPAGPAAPDRGSVLAGPWFGADDAVPLPPAVVPDLGSLKARRGPVDDLRSMLILLDCLTGLDFAARHPHMTPVERLEHVEHVRNVATSELLTLIESRVLELGQPPHEQIVRRRHGG